MQRFNTVPLHHAMCLHFVGLLAVISLVLVAKPTLAQPAEHPGTVRQPLVSDTLADEATQETFGLVRMTSPAGACSGAMLNPYWAITAAHCVFSVNPPFPLLAANQISIRARWQSADTTVTGLRVVPFSFPTGSPLVGGSFQTDIALIQVGLHDLPQAIFTQQRLHERPIAGVEMNTNEILAYGAGINSLAKLNTTTSPPTPVPSNSDGNFRIARFNYTDWSPHSTTPDTYDFPGERGARIAGGDSGGPSFVLDWDDERSPQRKLEWQLIGVHSACGFTCLPGQTCGPPNVWQWVSAVGRCTDSAVHNSLVRIRDVSSEISPDRNYIGSFDMSTTRAFFSVALDRPLEAFGGQGSEPQIGQCPPNPECKLGQDATQASWFIDPRALTVRNRGNRLCLGVKDNTAVDEAPIVLLPCSNEPTQQWWVRQRPGTDIDNIVNKVSGLCADLTLLLPASRFGPSRDPNANRSLLLRPCSNESNQQFRALSSKTGFPGRPG
jgi:Ricin-type beta-trefoil lectin domain-like/Trypsin